MNPKLILSLLPKALGERCYYRCFHRNHAKHLHLFKEASLTYAPGYKMVNLIPGDVISGNIAFNGYYERKLSKEILRLSRAGGTFLDVGANLGYFSLIWLAGNPNNKAIMIEASPRNKERLLANIHRNKLADRIQFFECAAGDSAKQVVFNLGPDDQSGWGGIGSGMPDSQSVEINMQRVDKLIDEKIDCMKIDVEGADTLVIRGCEDLLQRRLIERIYFEQNAERMSRLGLQEGDAVNFLRLYDYSCTPLSNDRSEWLAFPTSGIRD